MREIMTQDEAFGLGLSDFNSNADAAEFAAYLAEREREKEENADAEEE